MSGVTGGERFRIGYALAAKSVSSVFRDSLIDYAKERGVDLVPVDLDKPLSDGSQGPFDCLCHKLYDAEWRKQLEEFCLQNPNTIIVDPIEAIEKLHNRVSMLDAINDLTIHNLGMPKQVFVPDDSESLKDAIVHHGLKFPVIAKSLIANGSVDSHQMFLVLNEEGLIGVKTPVVLQEFINHGGVIFKVYVAGDHVKCVKRKSLTDISDDKLVNSENIIAFAQISSLTDHDQSDESYEKLIEAAEMPPLSFINEVANQLRHALKLHLFNFDMIRDSRDGTSHLVIDINYFPGYAKVPQYEPMLTDFFLDLAHQKRTRETSLDLEIKTHEADSNGQKLT